MAALAMMIGGAVLNATTFVGGSYLAKYLSGKDPEAEKKRHDLALEKFSRDREAWMENRERLADWMNQRKEEEGKAWQVMDDTDKALVLFNKVHAQSQIAHLDEPEWSNYFRPSQDQKTGEMVWVGGGMMALGYAVSKFL